MNHFEQCTALAEKFIPEIFDGTLSGPLLYVGAMPSRVHLVAELAEHFEIALIEIIPEYANHYAEDARFTKIATGDVRKLDDYFPETPQFNVSVWWHGPEHVPKVDFIPTVQTIERRTAELVMLASPYGVTKFNHDHARHPELNHVNALLPRDYSRLGYKVAFIGNQSRAQRGHYTHIMAWKWLKSRSA